MEPQMTLKNHNNPKKEQSRRHHTFGFQTIVQSYSNQNGMVLALKKDM